MNKTIIKRWNAKVKDGDWVYHVGDFCFKNSAGGKKGEGMIHKSAFYSSKLNGNIVYIKGNHDRNNGVKTIIERIIIKYGPHYICLVHNPDDYDANFGINFVGHIHNKWKFKRVFNPVVEDKYTDLINVGVDVWNFYPVTFEEIYSEYKKWSHQTSKKWQDHSEFVHKLKGAV